MIDKTGQNDGIVVLLYPSEVRIEMTCKEAERMVTPYINDELDGDELQAFLAHLENCSNCQEELEIYLITMLLLDTCIY